MTHSGAHSHQMAELVFRTGYICIQACDIVRTEKHMVLGGEGKRGKGGGAGQGMQLSSWK